MEYSEIFADRIRQLCAKRGITINKLATMAGLQQSTVDNIIHGASKNPRIKTLHKIALAFNMTVSEFLDFPELNDYNLEEDE
ncbi:MAG: helix-turn-helix transcriptional regulator [Clostridiales bacterium]|nr:helix-turn-helix transcriptional regulator [Clostridiales bacterium]